MRACWPRCLWRRWRGAAAAIAPSVLFGFFWPCSDVSWCLDIPGFVQLLRLPGMNMMSHNRLTFLTSFAILSLAAIGLDCLLRRSLKRRWWFWLPAVLLAGSFTWCIYRSYVLPEPLATTLASTICRKFRRGSPALHRHGGALRSGVVGWLLLCFKNPRAFVFFRCW